MITLDQAKALRHGDILTRTVANADPKGKSIGKVYRWRVNGKVKTWKKDASRVSVPLKFGLYDYFTLTEHDLHSFDPPARMIEQQTEESYDKLATGWVGEKIDKGAEGTALEQLGDIDPEAAAALMGY